MEYKFLRMIAVRGRRWTVPTAGHFLLAIGLAACNRNSGNPVRNDPSAPTAMPTAISSPTSVAPSTGAPSGTSTSTSSTNDPPPTTSLCSAGDQCVNVIYPSSIGSEADCYCPKCPGDFGKLQPMNKTCHDAYEASFKQYCVTWAASNCQPFPCPMPPPPTCSPDGVCVPSSTLPAPIPEAVLAP